MALIDLALLESNKVFVDTTQNPTNADLVGLGVGNADTVVYHGAGTIDLTTVIGASAINNSYVVATGGATVNINTALLDVKVLDQKNLIIDGNSTVHMSAGGLGVASGLTNLLNNTTISFSGSGGGTFIYDRPTIGVLAGVTLNVEDIGPGDRIQIPVAGSGVLGSGILREAANAYSGGYLRLENGDITNSVTVRIKMTQQQYNLYAANKGAYLNGSTDTFIFPGTADPDEPEYAVPCFARGTLLEGENGAMVAIEDLRVGDWVRTKDNGLQQIQWIGSRKLSTLDLINFPEHRPIKISAGALGANSPRQDLTVSPQHRILVRSTIAQKLFGAAEVLVAAKQLLVLEGVDIVAGVDGVEYFHVLFDRHEIVCSNGAETESLFTGPEALKGVGKSAAQEIFALFPDLRNDGHLTLPARPLLTGTPARQLAARHQQSGRALVMAN
ncbi:Hint domain-containing protein [Paracoccus sp. (in: a-proteobacteria)]|uniref:Hint domain-containing protein n=1 Tax=Paracoccus sp. TaxID=267 RepID=UPI0028A08D30|nr:Hint domain-containing protein [Paracoccus sp. (in: a-proteobacteria)]